MCTASRTTGCPPSSTAIAGMCLARVRRRHAPRWSGFGILKVCGRGLSADRLFYQLRRRSMALYELRTYTLRVGAMADAVKLYQELGFPALQRGGQDKKLVGYFQADTGTINQLVHLWKFDDDADRRKHWAGLSANKDFAEGFASKFRPLLMTQAVKLLHPAPWGPHP